MALESLFGRLSVRSQPICRGCRRAITTATPPQKLTTGRLQSASATEEALANLTRPLPQPIQPLQPARPLTPSSTPSAAGSGPTPANALRATANPASSVAARRTLKEERVALGVRRNDLESQISRRWAVGDVYAPHDLSSAEQTKWRQTHTTKKKKHDVMDELGINPLHHYKNFAMMSEYMTTMGRIRHSRETGLRPVNQRRMAKAIRRAIGVGLMPGVHRHPEVLRRTPGSLFR